MRIQKSIGLVQRCKLSHFLTLGQSKIKLIIITHDNWLLFLKPIKIVLFYYYLQALKRRPVDEDFFSNGSVAWQFTFGDLF